MSPLVDGEVVRDRDGILRDEKGRQSMAHLAVLLAMSLAWFIALAGVVALFRGLTDAATLIVSALGLAGTGAGLEGWQTHIEGRNLRERAP